MKPWATWIDRATNFTAYQQMIPEQSAKDEAALHLNTLAAKRTKYDEEIDDATDIVSDLFGRALKLSLEGSENRSALRVKRAQAKKKEQAKARNRVGGFAIPYAYAQQQLARAADDLQIALALFPLGAEANELMGLIFLQANDGRSAIRNFDVVASQGLPVSFYAEMRGHKQDQAVKCELHRDTLRFISLSSYDKKGNTVPPSKPAGDDGLGDLVVEPGADRQPAFDSLDLTLADIKKVETDKGVLKLKLTQKEIFLSPIYLPAFTPIEGPQARRFANNYTRLFVRYPGLEDSKLGAEGMTGGEKFKLGYNIATASVDIAMSGFTPHQRHQQRAGRHQHHPHHPLRHVLPQRNLRHLGTKRRRPATTPRRQRVQNNSNPTRESGVRAGTEVASPGGPEGHWGG